MFSINRRSHENFVLFNNFPFFLPDSYCQNIHGVENHGILAVAPENLSVGQTFTSTEKCLVTAIQFVVNQNGSGIGEWDLYVAEDPGDGNLIPELPIQDFSIDMTGLVTIELTTPFPLTANTTYRFEFTPKDSYVPDVYNIDVFHPAWQGSDYDGGHAVFDGVYFDGDNPMLSNSGFDLGRTDLLNDMDFGIITTIVIPTLSQWSIMTLSLLMLIVGLVFLRGRRLVFM